MCKWNRKNYRSCVHTWGSINCCGLGWCAVILYAESLLYFVTTNVHDYEYCYALYGLRLLPVLSCVTATIYLYSGYNKFMYDMLSGTFTLLNIVTRILTIIGFSYCAVHEGAINESNRALTAMLSINVLITAFLTAMFTAMTVLMCFECAGDCQRNDKLREEEHKQELQQLERVKADLERQKKLYEEKINDVAIRVAEPVNTDIPNADIVKTE